MEYPEDFSRQARARVEAERLKAGKDLERYRLQPQTRPHRPHCSGPDGRLWTDEEEDLHEYILRVFLVFSLEACALGSQGLWTVDQIREESSEFLRKFTIEACSEKGHGTCGTIPAMTNNWNGSILKEVELEFKRSDQWHRFEDTLLVVAEKQAKGITPEAARQDQPVRGLEVGLVVDLTTSQVEEAIRALNSVSSLSLTGISPQEVSKALEVLEAVQNRVRIFLRVRLEHNLSIG